ncbi:MAG TPA: response regulator [Polyangiaceae bacterium LLY-WYZ-15_(1-7)]|nr:response regulator [Polyangiaceae bacterium LLY-WYZ-15_(1-7)]
MAFRLTPRTLMGRLVLVTAVFLAVATGALLWQSNERLRERIEQGELARVRAIAATLALEVDGSAHRRAETRTPDRDAFVRWAEAPYQLQLIHAQLAKAAKENELIAPVETLVLRERHASRVRAAPNRRAEGAMAVVATSSDVPYFRHAADYLPEMAAALQGEVATKRPYADAHGTWISAFAPLRDHRGVVVGVLQVDAPLDRMLEEAEWHTGQQVLFAGLLLVILVCALILASFRLTQSLQRLASAARRFGQGDHETPIRERGTTAEVRQLASALEGARQRIAAQLAAQRESEKKLAEALQEAESATEVKSQFLANVSHELRTPMNAILGYSEMLIEDAELLGDAGVDFAEDLEKIKSAGEHLLALINDILDLSKVEAGRIELFYEDFDVEALVDEVADTVAPLVQKGGNRLVRDVDAEVGEMHGDAMRTRQILFNLLSNAAKFTSEGEITLRVWREDDDVLFEVADTGIGMTGDQLARLFTPFMQADASTTRKYGGTGLGLSLSKEFCELLGGQIVVESVPGEGSTFCVRLPGHTARRSSLPEEGPKSTEPEGPPRGLVLVIDDDRSVRELMARTLIREGYAVTVAANGRDGLAAGEARRPDAIVLDVQLPDTSGWELLAQLKRHPSLADVPVVLVSMIEDRSKGLALGATDYLTKPVDWDRLRAVLRRQTAEGEVLVVDDDPAIRDVVERTLEREGYAVRTAAGGAEAL